MNLIKKIYNTLVFRLKYYMYIYISIRDIKRISNQKKVLLFGVPYHNNAGDNAQTVCSMKWIQNNYPNRIILLYFDVFLERCSCLLIRLLRKYVNENDLVILHSGYHTTDLYPVEERMQRKTIELFPECNIYIFPQTVYFQNKEYEEEVSKIYNNHRHLKLLCRDRISYEKAKIIFPKLDIMLFPDIVCNMIGNKYFEKDRNGIFLCLRTGKEAKINTKEKNILKNSLSDVDEVFCGDTDINANINDIIANRESYINDFVNSLSTYKLVVTDRYHGMIFSLAANTPVIVLPTNDHKLESGVEWFENTAVFNEYCFFEKSVYDVKKTAEYVYSHSYDYKLPAYFSTHYYNYLYSWLEGDEKCEFDQIYHK